MHRFPVFAAIVVLAGTSAAAHSELKAAARPAASPAIYIKHTEVTVLVTNGEGHRAVLSTGYNRLGEQHPLGCDHDEGCLVTVASMVGISDVADVWAICTLVDGVPTRPRCPHQNSAVGSRGGVGNGLASFLLTKGRHMVETDVLLTGTGGAHLNNWEVHYTVMLDPPKGKN